MSPGQVIAGGVWALLVLWLVWEFWHAADEPPEWAEYRIARERHEDELTSRVLVALDETRTPPCERRWHS